ncbi:MAG: hypothetical protein ACD_12C00136G0002 [uncultured bacterium]|nr:MAG: hypothetical protein ACD_12C00136G0002 [uncultured bacterium]
MSRSFGSKQLVRCLESFGFIFNRQGSSHAIYNCPVNHQPPVGVRPYMTVQLGRKAYDPHSANRYISEIKKFGFSKKEIETGLK